MTFLQNFVSPIKDANSIRLSPNFSIATLVEKYNSYTSGTMTGNGNQKVGLLGYDILFAYFVVEAESKKIDITFLVFGV